MYKLFFSPVGRIPASRFAIGVLGLMVLSLIISWVFSTYGFSVSPDDAAVVETGRDNKDVIKAPKGTWAALFVFWISFAVPFIAMHIAYCVYVKRLHDIGRSAWVFTAVIALEIMIIIALMLAFGGADYFEAFAQFDRKEDIDPVVLKGIIDTYNQSIAANMKIIGPAMWILPAIFTVWLGLAKGQGKTNQWGEPPIAGAS